MAAYISDFVYYLQDVGVYEYVLPFLLVFTIIFAILEKTKLFGKEQDGRAKTNINTILALVIGLIVIANTDISLLMNSYLSKMALFIVIVLIFILTIGIFGANAEGGFTGAPFLIFILIAIGAVFWALSPSLGLELPFYFSDQDKSVLFGIIAFVVILFFITRRDNPHRNGNGMAGFFDGLARGFRGQ